MQSKITFGKERTYQWKDIKIDEGNGYPIIKDGTEIVGGILVSKNKAINNLIMGNIHGIEIVPEYRKMKLGSGIVRMMMDEVDLLVGGINNDCVGFWKKMGAIVFKIPNEIIPENIKRNEDPDKLFAFFIAKKPEYGIGLENMIKEKFKQLYEFSKTKNNPS